MTDKEKLARRNQRLKNDIEHLKGVLAHEREIAESLRVRVRKYEGFSRAFVDCLVECAKGGQVPNVEHWLKRSKEVWA